MDWLAHQTEINGRMRQILVAWVWEATQYFRLQSRTFFLSIAYVDMYLAKNVIARSRLQLLGVAALWVASKVEEIHLPKLLDFVLICDTAYTTRQVIDMEKELLITLDFALCVKVFEGSNPIDICASVLLSVHDNITTTMSASRRNRMIRGIAMCLRTKTTARRGRAKLVIGLIDDQQVKLGSLKKLISDHVGA